MSRRPGRIRRILAAATLGMMLSSAVAPQGCAGYLQQNLEVLFSFDAIANSPEMWQSWIWQVLRGG